MSRLWETFQQMYPTIEEKYLGDISLNLKNGYIFQFIYWGLVPQSKTNKSPPDDLVYYRLGHRFRI